MKKAFLLLFAVAIFCLGCDNGTTSPQGNIAKSGGYGIWLISNFQDGSSYLYDDIIANAQNDKQSTPTGIAYIPNLTAQFVANFKEPIQNNPDYNEPSPSGGWWGFDGQGGNITIPAGDYYVLIVEMWLPTGNFNDGFEWMFDDAMVYTAGGATAVTTTISSPITTKVFNKTSFKKISDL